MANVCTFAIAGRCGNVMQNCERGAVSMFHNCGEGAKIPRHG
jgi:hypothetical protein